MLFRSYYERDVLEAKGQFLPIYRNPCNTVSSVGRKGLFWKVTLGCPWSSCYDLLPSVVVKTQSRSWNFWYHLPLAVWTATGEYLKSRIMGLVMDREAWRAAIHGVVLFPPPQAVSVLQGSGLGFSLELPAPPTSLSLPSSGLWGLLQAAAGFGSDTLSGTSPLHCGGL